MPLCCVDMGFPSHILTFAMFYCLMVGKVLARLSITGIWVCQVYHRLLFCVGFCCQDCCVLRVFLRGVRFVLLVWRVRRLLSEGVILYHDYITNVVNTDDRLSLVRKRDTSTLPLSIDIMTIRSNY